MRRAVISEAVKLIGRKGPADRLLVLRFRSLNHIDITD
jgi:hypothetical protein